MTAIGLAMCLVGWLALWISTEVFNAPTWVDVTFGIMTVIGGALGLAGVFMWIWKVMP